MTRFSRTRASDVAATRSASLRAVDPISARRFLVSRTAVDSLRRARDSHSNRRGFGVQSKIHSQAVDNLGINHHSNCAPPKLFFTAGGNSLSVQKVARSTGR
ncbi:hypothetical protein [Burkholderia pseudomallei]|uniref:hypothetical protein n=1 Tax=Burkholderia pseudomallei TaxID=28450 RepID=UPI0009B20F42|nr:hypothetical protein [Burkholderia pseudomallei]